MRAAVMRDHRLVVDEVPDPVPGPGQVLVRRLACGICGSDLHFLEHGERMARMQEELGRARLRRIDLTKDLVMGHEFSAEVLELGPETSGVEPGDVVVSMPVMIGSSPTMEDADAIGHSNDCP